MVHHVCMQLAISCGIEIISPLCGICSTYKTLEFCSVVPHLQSLLAVLESLHHRDYGTGGANTLLQDLTNLCQQDKVCTKAHLRRCSCLLSMFTLGYKGFLPQAPSFSNSSSALLVRFSVTPSASLRGRTDTYSAVVLILLLDPDT